MKLNKTTLIIFSLTFALIMALLLPPASAQTWKFAMISDTHDDDKAHTETGVTARLAPIISYIIEEHPDFVLETGDLITGVLTKKTSPVYKKYDRQYGYFQQATAPLTQSNILLLVIRGNHDYGTFNEDPAATKAYMEAFAGTMPQNGPADAKGLSYSFVHNKLKFIMLDQYVNASSGSVTLPMDLLKSELENSLGAEHIFVMGHSPAFTLNSNTSDDAAHFNLFDQPALRDQFWNLLTDNHVTAYVSGHKHLYSRSQVNGVAQIVIGNLGSASSFHPANADSRLTNIFPINLVSKTEVRPGYIIFTIDDSKNSITANEYWLDENNNKYLFDTYSLQ